jgi:hypothetical protein
MKTRNLAELYDLAPLDWEVTAVHTREPGGATTWSFSG